MHYWVSLFWGFFRVVFFQHWHANCTLTLGVDLFGNLQSVRVGQIGVGRGHGQHQAVLLGDKLHQHVSNLGLDVRRLVAHRHLGHPRQVHQGQVEHWGRRGAGCWSGGGEAPQRESHSRRESACWVIRAGRTRHASMQVGFQRLTVRRVDAQVDGNRWDSLVSSRDAIRLGLNLLPHFVKVCELFALAVEELGVFWEERRGRDWQRSQPLGRERERLQDS